MAWGAFICLVVFMKSWSVQSFYFNHSRIGEVTEYITNTEKNNVIKFRKQQRMNAEFDSRNFDSDKFQKYENESEAKEFVFPLLLRNMQEEIIGNLRNNKDFDEITTRGNIVVKDEIIEDLLPKSNETQSFGSCEDSVKCVDCVQNSLKCTWCHSEGCKESAKMCHKTSSIFVTLPERATHITGPSACPAILYHGVVNIPDNVGYKLSIKIRVGTRDLFFNDLRCNFTFGNRSLEVNAILNVDTIICDPVLFSLSYKLGGQVNGQFRLYWAGSDPYSEPLPLVLYKCEDLAETCEKCLSLYRKNLDCGWCVVNGMCTVRTSCPEKTWVQPVSKAPQDVIEGSCKLLEINYGTTNTPNFDAEKSTEYPLSNQHDLTAMSDSITQMKSPPIYLADLYRDNVGLRERDAEMNIKPNDEEMMYLYQ